MKKNVLFIDGVPDDKKMMIRKIEKNGRIRWWGSGTSNISSFLKNNMFNQFNIVFDTKADQVLPGQNIHAVFNQVSDADTHKNVLRKADAFYNIASKHIPFFNPPSLVMKTTRDNVYQILQGIDKLHVPKTVKFQPKSPSDIYDTIKKEKFEFPVIFRQAGDHGGISTIRVDNETEMFHMFALDGRDYYLTQFVEYEENSLYKKYRLMVVDGKVYLRHVKISAGWMVHNKTQIENPEQLQKIGAKRFRDNKEAIQQIITKIYECLKLDYFGIDCYIDEKINILIFEINPNMAAFWLAKGDIFSKNVDELRKAVVKMIASRIL